MNRTKDLNTSTKLTFLLAGGGIGAILALLFAPKAGPDLRHDIAEAARKGADQTRHTAQQVKEQATVYYGTARDQATDLYHTAKDKAQELKAKVQELPAQARQAAQSTAAPVLEAAKSSTEEKPSPKAQAQTASPQPRA